MGTDQSTNKLYEQAPRMLDNASRKKPPNTTKTTSHLTLYQERYVERHYPQEKNSLEQLPNAVLRPAQVINNDRDNIPEISEIINARI